MSINGDRAKLRRIVGYLDSALSLCESDEVFGLHEYHEMQAMIDALVRSRRCASNIALRLGDETLFTSSPVIRLKVEMPK